MRPDSLFFVAFLGQIFLMSYYLPEKLLARMRYIVDTYPPEHYPKLYPHPVEHYRMGQMLFRFAYRCILALGLVLLVAIAFFVDHASFADDGHISEAWPAIYAAIQFIPILLLEFTQYNQMKILRRTQAPTRRRAELRPRGLFDYAPPGLLAIAVGACVATIVFDLYVGGFQFSLNRDSVQRSLSLIVSNGFMGAIGAWQIYGRKLNPLQARPDHLRQVQAGVHSMLYVSITVSLFFAVQTIDDIYPIDFLDATLMSLYFQAVALLSLGYILRSLRVEDVDFSVYRSDAATN